MNFVQLSTETGRVLWVNLERVQTMSATGAGGSRLIFSDRQTYDTRYVDDLVVTQAPNQILQQAEEKQNMTTNNFGWSYPAGAAGDPRAPYNQDDSAYEQWLESFDPKDAAIGIARSISDCHFDGGLSDTAILSIAVAIYDRAGTQNLRDAAINEGLFRPFDEWLEVQNEWLALRNERPE